MATSRIESLGYVVNDGFASAEKCRKLLDAIEEFRSRKDLPEIHRAARGRELRYSVIDGNEIRDELPDIWDLYTGRVRDMMTEVAGWQMFPLKNTRVGVNVNIMAPGRSEYRWHYDRTPMTAVLYLNEVVGGETELYPGLRVLLPNERRVRAQKLLDRAVATRLGKSLRARKVVVAPKPGRLVAMAGNRCLHSVRGVEGDHDRINIILAYDREGASFAAEKDLDSYLYTTNSVPQQDPNYLR